MCRLCDPYSEPIVPNDGGARVAAFIFWAVWTLVLMAFAFWTGRASASELDTIRDAAWFAYHNKQVITSDGVRDCDDNMLFAYRYLAERGIASAPGFCTRNGNGHVFLRVGHMVIDNWSLVPTEEVVARIKRRCHAQM